MTPITLYVSIANKRYYTSPYDSPWEFKLQIEPQYVKVFDQLFNQSSTLDQQNFWRAQLPYVPYHLDPENDEIDLRLKKMYALVHEFGDAETKQLIEQMPYYS
ncbi:transposase [Viridibacillus sp. YIM B01967]|uniref:Transposase n=1 Tax=Viridibacillus soli TaxID=2798301 RepID=A0ABS1H9W9_9BACL|nr:transposase [Viridibacillus soli]MBK3496094.1 transposase [Viridibacillus soli]